MNRLLKRDLQVWLVLGTAMVVLGLIGVFTHQEGGMYPWTIVSVGVLYIGFALGRERKRRGASISDEARYTPKLKASSNQVDKDD